MFMPDVLLARLARFVDYRFVADEFVTVLLQDRAGEGAPADDEDALVVLFELIHQGNEIAVAADDGKGVDVVVSERHFESVQRQIDIGAVLVAARRRIALHHLYGVFGEGRVAASCLPQFA